MYIRTKKRNERKIKNTNKGKIANDNRRVYSNKYGNKKKQDLTRQTKWMDINKCSWKKFEKIKGKGEKNFVNWVNKEKT